MYLYIFDKIIFMNCTYCKIFQFIFNDIYIYIIINILIIELIELIELYRLSDSKCILIK